jgi:hypothetical protein
MRTVTPTSQVIAAHSRPGRSFRSDTERTGKDMEMDTNKLVEGYFAMWNEADAEARRAVVAETWTADASYLDPMFSADGHDGLDAMVAGVHQQFPGHAFRLTSEVDTHHDRVRWTWALAPVAGGAPVATGLDVAVVAADGRFSHVTGFIDAPAA